MPRDRHFLIAGVRWLWRYTRLKGRANGWTHYPHETSQAKILVDSRLKGRARLTIELHEAMHACFPQIDEESITEAAKDVARILWTLGYRIDDQKVDQSAR
ncbi:MAG: hypothetical protein EBR82_40805 [Caulobacteraceae bacterium]|nr:hypothetical protein [Caulobacteraceae bacterium]NDD04818.1 hypothetical protein [Pseudomonadota bacterium]NDG19409.1 hypothetical protein [Betaproteobacteria bacterium]